MSSDRKLISAVLDRGNLTLPLEKGVSEAVFTDTASAKAFRWIFRYYAKYRQVPTKDRFKQQFPDFRTIKIHKDEPFEDIVESIMDNVRYKLVVTRIRELAESIDNEDEGVYDQFIKAGLELAGISSTGDMIRFRGDMEHRIDEYQKKIEAGESPYGIRFGLPSIDEATYGAHPGDLITIAARLGTGKSNLLKHIIKTAFLAHKNVIVFSLEESESLFRRRFDAMMNDLAYNDFKGLKLPKEEIQRWRKNAKQFLEDHDNEVAIVSGLKRMTPETILSYTERFKPDLVAIDGVHLLRTGTGGYSPDWRSITTALDEIKQMALYSKTPFVGVVQSNRTSAKEGVSAENISFADAIGQLSDIVIGIWQDKKMEAKQIASLNLAKNRDGQKLQNLMYRWKLGPETIDIHELTEKEQRDLELFDDDDDED